LAYLRVFNRLATADELAAGKRFLQEQSDRLQAEGREADQLALPDGHSTKQPYRAAALVDFCLALFNANEFLYLE